MTDQNIPADVTPEDMEHARAYVQDFLDATCAPDRTLAVARVLQALLPAPPRPTLAGIPREERDGCRWMQADVKGRSARYVIATPSDRNGLAGLVSADGGIEWTYPERITPRPDLPRMEWPSTGQGAEDATPAKAGTVIESATDPRLAALPIGSILLDRDGEATTKRPGAWTGLGNTPVPDEGDEFGPWTVLHVG